MGTEILPGFASGGAGTSYNVECGVRCPLLLGDATRCVDRILGNIDQCFPELLPKIRTF
jgi:hypothetical protein